MKWTPTRLLIVLLMTLWMIRPCRAETQDLIGRVDEAFSREMKKYDLPGGVVVIVQDGAVVFSRGYGYADLERKIPVNPDTTLFYLASVTKTFTATAVMQQVEKGKLDLDRDVNDYLKEFKVPASWPKPVTLRALLTHTAGFEDRNVGYVARTRREALSLAEYLRLSLPIRVLPPGRALGYSNHGYGLAGHLVEVVSGEPFADYLEGHVLEPLAMRHSTAHTPPPEGLSGQAATMYAYNRAADRYEPVAPGYRNLPPAGTVWASGTDMSRFLLAHLQGGDAGIGHILARESVALMQQRQFSQHPRLPGFCFGFYERFHFGSRVLEHAGGYTGAATLIALLPDSQFGIFLATNQATSFPHYAALQAALDVLCPASPPQDSRALPVPEGWDGRARGIEGYYQNNRYSRTSLEKIAILDTQVKVRIAAPGQLSVSPRNGQETRWREIEPLLFRRERSQDYLSFEEENGRGTWMFMSLPGSAVPSAFQRTPWYETVAVQVPFMLAVSVLLLSTVTLWPVTALGVRLVRRLRGRAAGHSPNGIFPASCAALSGILVAAFIAGIDMMLGNSQYRLQMVYGMPGPMVVLLWIPIALVALAILQVFFTVRIWRRGTWNLAARIYYTLVTIAAVTFIPFLWNWNLLGFHY